MPIEKIPYAINSVLKNSIIIKNAQEVDENFHARYCCKGKKYRYVIDNSKYGSSIYRGLQYHISQELNIEEMQKAIKHFEGEHDFKRI